jgi:3-deoxy-D-manno-octulosonic-acid transferase
MIIYHLLWTLVVLLIAPFLIFRKDERLRARIVPELPADPPGKGCLWVHALSVGEVLSAAPLVRDLRVKYPSHALVLTVTTVQGMAVARQELQGDAALILPMPLDFWWSYGRLYRFLNPAVLIIVETDIWPGLIHSLRRKKIPTVVVNGRVSPRTHRGYRRMGPLAGLFLNKPCMWLMQSKLDKERLLDVGADPERVETSGNIKFDKEWMPMDVAEREKVSAVLGVAPDDLVWVAGSTHPGEEELILKVFRALRERFVAVRLVLAPRRVERAGEVRDLAGSIGLKAAFRSGPESDKDGSPIVILDTLGELARVYGLSHVSFVGGSLVPIGGHNLLEPAWFGRPVLFGPHMDNFKAMSELLLEAGGGARVRDADELEKKMSVLLSSPLEAEKMGKLAKDFVISNRGALARVQECIGGLISNGS